MKEINDVSPLKPYDTVTLTGGEPMLYPDRIVDIMSALRQQNPKQKIYLYTTIWTHQLKAIIEYFHGVQFTIHRNPTATDTGAFFLFQQHILSQFKTEEKSFRLSLDPTINTSICIIPQAWSRIKIKQWRTPDKLRIPEGSNNLFILKPDNETNGRKGLRLDPVLHN